ncbi:hypothetical protein ABID82_001705 [Methylobacterium sp. PvP062]|uniref:Uncharacterized protein n=2 Tax=Methylobacterium TaxID=407 RepID=A0A509EI92_9HYPH|nr:MULTISPECIES: hypothetical protein [Methylobacterium]MCX7333272.1 hypothetical protein [Hyphomicrobiales bacterium]MCY4505467.1 hypothetical protein [Acidobacteriota bacterium]GAN47234.1 hypothetical protein ME121_1240 [Methylobacterium sp. ME121]MBN6818487.1 hypothetical protein [Methylobacterium organophilum]MBP2492909.1 hypothetical protein [Methylobacterium sp. PvP105]
MRIYPETPVRITLPQAVVIHPDWDRPTPPVTRPADFEVVKARLVAALAAEVIRMLGAWVSELDPVVIYAPGGGQLGLSLAGDPEARIVVPSRLSTLDSIVAEVTGGVKPV